MPNCDNCGAFVTPSFVRVFGDNAGDLPGCPECSTVNRLTDAGALYR